MHNYKLLQALASILETQNLSESARLLNVTQSTMSKTLGQIREEFSDRILIREGNQYVLTKRATELKVKLPTILSQLEQLYKPIEIVPRQISRHFTIGFNAYVAPTILPQVCAKIESEAPRATIECQLWQKEKLDDLFESSIDLVATMATDIPDNIYGKRLGKDDFVVIMCNKHAKAKGDFTLNDVADAKHILVNGIVDTRSADNALLAPTGKTRNIFAIVPSFLSAVQSLKLTQAIMVAPSHIASQYVDEHQLTVKPLPIDLPSHSYYLLWHAKHQNDPEHQWFRELIFPLLQKNLRDSTEAGSQLLNSC